MVFRWLRRKEKVAGAMPAVPDLAPPLVPKTRWQQLAEGLGAALDVIDDGISRIAIPFGVLVREPRKRFAILQGVFAGLFLLGALPVPYVPLVALALGYVGVLAISRAWVVNERKRTAIVK